MLFSPYISPPPTQANPQNQAIKPKPSITTPLLDKAKSPAAALSLFLSVVLAVAFAASVSPVPFKQVSCASGWVSSLDESPPGAGKKRVRTGVMLKRFSVMEATSTVPVVL